jgi:hypothetical protein
LGSYRWSVGVTGIDGFRYISLGVEGFGDRRRSYTDLRSFVAAGVIRVCPATGTLLLSCDSIPFTAAVDGRRVLLLLRDTRAIERLFRMRPDSVDVYRQVGEARERALVPVEYVSPQLPPPDSTFVAEAARAKRRFEARINSISRYIGGGSIFDTAPLWIAFGDSLPLVITEVRCTNDLCSSGGVQFQGAEWSVDQTAVARLREPYLVAVAPGRTRIRAKLPPSPADTEPFREPPPHILQREVFVAPPVVRLAISTASDTIIANERVAVGLRLYDRNGELLDGVTLQLTYTEGDNAFRTSAVTPSAVLTFQTPGRRIIAAKFGTLVDTLRVVVIPAGKR